MGPANVFGEEAFAIDAVDEVSPADLSTLGDNVWLLDMRPKREFAAGHLPGSIALEMRDDFGTWAGWVLPFNAPVALVMNHDQDLDEALRQLGRIGFDDVRGVVRGLSRNGVDLESYRIVDTAGFVAGVDAGNQVLDARAPDEWDLGTVPGSIKAYAPDVAAESPGELDASREVWIACETGYRANIAASFLQREGFEPVVLVDAGIPEVVAELAGRDK